MADARADALRAWICVYASDPDAALDSFADGVVIDTLCSDILPDAEPPSEITGEIHRTAWRLDRFFEARGTATEFDADAASRGDVAAIATIVEFLLAAAVLGENCSEHITTITELPQDHQEQLMLIVQRFLPVTDEDECPPPETSDDLDATATMTTAGGAMTTMTTPRKSLGSDLAFGSNFKRTPSAAAASAAAASQASPFAGWSRGSPASALQSRRKMREHVRSLRERAERLERALAQSRVDAETAAAQTAATLRAMEAERRRDAEAAAAEVEAAAAAAARLAQRETELREARDALRDATTELERLRVDHTELASLRDEVDVLRSQAAARTKAEQLAARMREQVEAAAGLRERITVLEDANRALTTRALDAEREAATIPRLRKQMEEARAARCEAEVRVAETADKLTSAERSAASLREALDAVRSERSRTARDAAAVATAASASTGSGSDVDGSHGIGSSVSEFNPEVAERLERLERDNAALREALSAADGDRLARLETSLEDEQRMRDAFRERFISARARAEELEGERDAAHAEIANLKRLLDTSTAQCAALRDRVAAAEARVDDTAAALAAVRSRLEETLASLAAERAEHASTRQEAAAALERHEAQRSAQEEAHSRAIVALQVAHDEASRVAAAEFEAAMHEAERLQEEAATSAAAELDAAARRADERVAEIRSQGEARVTALETEFSGLRAVLEARIVKLDQELIEQKRCIAELERNLSARSAELHTERTRCADLEDHLATRGSELRAARAEADQARAEAEQAEEELAAAQRQLGTAEARARHARRDALRAGGSDRDALAQLRDANERIAALTSHVASLEGDAARMRSALTTAGLAPPTLTTDADSTSTTADCDKDVPSSDSDAAAGAPVPAVEDPSSADATTRGSKRPRRVVTSGGAVRVSVAPAPAAGGAAGPAAAVGAGSKGSTTAGGAAGAGSSVDGGVSEEGFGAALRSYETKIADMRRENQQLDFKFREAVQERLERERELDEARRGTEAIRADLRHMQLLKERLAFFLQSRTTVDSKQLLHMLSVGSSASSTTAPSTSAPADPPASSGPPVAESDDTDEDFRPAGAALGSAAPTRPTALQARPANVAQPIVASAVKTRAASIYSRSSTAMVAARVTRATAAAASSASAAPSGSTGSRLPSLL